jgi:hypothetical protein
MTSYAHRQTQNGKNPAADHATNPHGDQFK